MKPSEIEEEYFPSRVDPLSEAEDDIVICYHCGWTGTGEQLHIDNSRTGLIKFNCPVCGKKLVSI